MDENAKIPTGPDDPQKYIRTFEGDIQKQQEAGAPALAGSAPTGPAPVELPQLFPKKSPPEHTLLPPAPPQPRAVPPPLPPPDLSKAPPLRTYSSDFSERVKKSDASTLSIVAAEQDRAKPRPAPQLEETPISGRTIFYIVGGVALFIVAGISAYAVYAIFLSPSAPTASAPAISAPIFVDDRVQIAGQGSALQQSMTQAVAKPLGSGNVRLLYTNASSTSSVFAQLSLFAPDLLLRNINPAGSMAGAVNINGNQSPFFILSVTSYGDTFAAMLSWEPAMPRNLNVLFPPYPAPAVVAPVATTTATSSPQTSTTTAPAAPAIQPSFRDEVVNNHDVRAYRDASGKSVFLYGYWNQTTLVIARDPGSFTEVLQRLATSRAAP